MEDVQDGRSTGMVQGLDCSLLTHSTPHVSISVWSIVPEFPAEMIGRIITLTANDIILNLYKKYAL